MARKAAVLEAPPESPVAPAVEAPVAPTPEPEARPVRDDPKLLASTEDSEPDHSMPEPEAEESAETDAFDADLLRQAEQVYGFGAEDARAFGSPENLRRSMARLDIKAAEWAEKQLNWGEPPAEPAPQQPPAPPAPPQTPAEQRAAVFEKFKLELDPNEYDDKIVAVLNGMNDHYHNQINAAIAKRDEEISALGQQWQHLTGQQQAEFHSQLAGELDAYFAGLGDEFEDIYGKEPIASLPPDSPKVKQRQDYWKRMNALAIADAQNGRQNLSRKELFERTTYSLNPEKIKASARKELLAKVEQRRGQAMPRPAGVNGKHPQGEAAAMQFVRDFVRDRGIKDDEL